MRPSRSPLTTFVVPAMLLGFALAVACSVDPVDESLRFACKTDPQCGAGFFCGPRGFCVKGTAPAAGADAGADVGPAAEPPDAAEDLCSTCTTAEPCDSFTHTCRCNSLSCSLGFLCNASTGKCAEDPCAKCSSSEPCDLATRTCRCSAGSCGAGFICNGATSKCEVDPCGPCPAGEACELATKRCKCSTSSCPAGKWCSLATTTCEVDPCLSCKGEEPACDPLTHACTCTATSCTTPGLVCDPTTPGKCECTATSCSAGFVCEPVSKTCKTLVGDPCAVDRDCGAGGRCVVPAVAPFEWARGYCTYLCSPAPDSCPTGSRCVNDGGNGIANTNLICYRSCATSAECRTGYACVIVNKPSTGAIKACAPASSNATGAGIGDPCTANADCLKEGQCLDASLGWPGGYCTTQYCQYGQKCAPGSICPRFFGPAEGRCLKSCLNSAECRTEASATQTYECSAQNEMTKFCSPLPPPIPSSTPLLARCTLDSQCPGGTCFNFPNGGMCTAYCSDRNPCPAGSKCVEYNTAQPGINAACFKTCTGNAACSARAADGYACSAVIGSLFNGTCAPAGY